MRYLKDCDTVYKLATLPRWQKEWINEQKTLNFSGIIQETFNEIIKQQDPTYFEKNKHNIEKRKPRRLETTLIIMRKNSDT